jgi:SAM-dependent methyltransferase
VNPPEERAHGVTPGLRRDYAGRTAEMQAAFVLPHLGPGMRLLDVGCGPGTITLGLARAVSPGRVTGIDHDPDHVAAALRLARERGITNASFQLGDVLALPFPDDVFDAAFENNVLTHLSGDATRAAEEVYRVLRPGGLFAARDVDADAVMWGAQDEWMRRFDSLFHAWQRSRGSDITMGTRLSGILREAGFVDTRKSVSADTKGTREDVRAHAEIMTLLLAGPVGRLAQDRGLADEASLRHMRDSVGAWGEHPDAFFANVHVEVIGWKKVPPVSHRDPASED